MPDLSSITLPDNNTYNFKDTVARASIPYTTVDSTSTATVFTATVDGITSLYDGVTVMLHNGVVTSASGFTLNVNGLGAKPCYNNLTNATRDTTIFNVAYTMLFVYSTALNNGDGGWWIYRGYDANTNTIGYQLRTNSALRPAKVRGYRYRIWFTALDGKHWVPANESSSTNATSSRTPSDEVIDPFGEIVYNSTNGTVNANANIPAATAWTQYALSLGYSFNHEGDELNLTYPAPVYVKCQPQTSGGVVMKDYTQTLPSTDDGYVYLFLGMAYSATNIELFQNHPVYYYANGAVRLWTNAEASASKKVFTASATWQGSEAQCEFDDGGSYSEIAAILEDGGFPVIRLEQSSGEYVECYPSGYDADGNLQFFGFIVGDPIKVAYTAFDGYGDGTQFFAYVDDNIGALPPNSASINSSGLITFKNGIINLFTLQLPLYNGGVS